MENIKTVAYSRLEQLVLESEKNSGRLEAGKLPLEDLRAELDRRNNLRSQDVKKLKNLVKNYEEKGRTEGATWSLIEVERELQRREGKDYNGRDAARRIVELSNSSDDGLATYKDIWSEFYPDQDWTGHGTQTQAKEILAAAISYCVDHNLPIVTTAIVAKGSRRATDEAKKNIYKEAEKLGINVGHSVEEFYQNQLELTQKLEPDDI